MTFFMKTASKGRINSCSLQRWKIIKNFTKKKRIDSEKHKLSSYIKAFNVTKPPNDTVFLSIFTIK